jgi:hypothetical protein
MRLLKILALSAALAAFGAGTALAQSEKLDGPGPTATSPDKHRSAKKKVTAKKYAKKKYVAKKHAAKKGVKKKVVTAKKPAKKKIVVAKKKTTPPDAEKAPGDPPGSTTN